jgi:hypothetical protein
MINDDEDCDTVLYASSNTILQFETIELRGKQTPKLQLTVPQVYTPSLIKNKIAIQPLSSRERIDDRKLTQNYSEVINNYCSVRFLGD